MSTDTRHLHPVTEAPPDDDYDQRHDASPHNADAERALIGIALTHSQAITDAATVITPSDFHAIRHELIWTAIEHLYSRGEPVDTITVTDHLDQQGQLKRAGGAAHLWTLATSTLATPASAGYYADIIANTAARRRLTTAATALHQLATSPSGDTPDTIKTRALELLAAIPTAPPGITPDQDLGPWQAIDLTAHVDGTAPPDPGATLLHRHDGKNLMYASAIHSIAGEPGSGKTFFGLIGAVQQLNQGALVTMLDFEDRPSRLTRRLLQLGATPDQIIHQFRYVHPDVALTAAGRRDLDAAVDGASLVIIDGITEAMTLQGMSYLDNEAIAQWLALIPTYIANQGPAVLQIDHLPKAKDNQQRFAIGGGHKLAAIDGVAFMADVIKGFAKGTKGSTKIVISKDKNGDVGPNGMTIATMNVDATNDDGTIYAWLDTPTPSLDDEGHFRPTILMGRVCQFLIAHPGATGNLIRAGVRGKDAAITQAIEALTREGNVRTETAANRAVFYYLTAPFQDNE